MPKSHCYSSQKPKATAIRNAEIPPLFEPKTQGYGYKKYRNPTAIRAKNPKLRLIRNTEIPPLFEPKTQGYNKCRNPTVIRAKDPRLLL
ncbi:hypothetical protein M8J76_012471 [Diaphorina citri]|nr:hypothetical protein M8J76_012471 [Diaphorina citri]